MEVQQIVIHFPLILILLKLMSLCKVVLVFLSVDIENLTNAFVLNGTRVVSEGKTIATYQIEYGEDISRLFAVVDYNVQLKNI